MVVIQNKEEQFENATIEFDDDRIFTVIVGANNSGKSTFIRSVAKTFRDEAYKVDVNRTILRGEGAFETNYHKNYASYWGQSVDTTTDNFEKPVQILQDFFGLKNHERNPILEWYNKYFPNPIYLERDDPDNDASPMLLKSNGHSITHQGSGIRATIEIFVKLFDPRIHYLCIDEPELGLEPVLQKYLFQALKEKASADKRIFIATHSHHFIDHELPENNFVCSRDSVGKISVVKAADLQDVVFRLLGNTLSSLMLPEQVLIVEGPSDDSYQKKILKLLDKANYAIQGSGGSGNIKCAFNSITQFLRFVDKQLPVYKEKIFVVVDKPDRDIEIREWRTLLGEDKVCVLPKNGIEYFYPERILQSVFKTGDGLDAIVAGYLANSPNGYNGENLSKTQLAKRVAEELTIDDLKAAGNELFEFLAKLP